LAKIFGLYQGSDVNNRDSDDVHKNKYRPVCDTHPEYDPISKHPYLAGYNSANYDTVMLALFFHEALDHVWRGETFHPINPKVMRDYNNKLFSENYRNYMPSFLTKGESMQWGSAPHLIWKAFINSGRHVDVAKLNVTQQKVGLKRLLGGLGRQILESDRLSNNSATLTNQQDFYDLLAYNVSDVVGLAKLFEHPVYASGFDLKKSLLDEYPETIYNQIPDTHKPNVAQDAVRGDRLTPDSTSAKFVARILAPYENLDDIPAVSFMYPSEQVASQTGIPRRNILDESIAFFRDNISADTPSGKKAHEIFMTAMEYYRSIEGKDFNNNHLDDPQQKQLSLAEIPKRPMNVPYFLADGTPSSCFVTFSTGGIHGAEYDVTSYQNACAEVDAYNRDLVEVQEKFPDPLDFWLAHPGKKTFITSQGHSLTRSQIFTTGTSLKLLREQREKNITLPQVGYRSPKEYPELFEATKDGGNKLKPQFARTSASLVIHEDFTSYYHFIIHNWGRTGMQKSSTIRNTMVICLNSPISHQKKSLA